MFLARGEMTPGRSETSRFQFGRYMFDYGTMRKEGLYHRLTLLGLIMIGCFPQSGLATPFEDAVRGTIKLTGSGVAGTGFVIRKGDKHFIGTAAHVFHDFKGETCEVIYRARVEGQPSERRSTTLAIRKGDQPLWKQHGKHDIAIIEFTLPEEADCRPFEWDQIAKRDVAEKGVIGVGREVCIPCYPVKTEANAAGWPILRRGTIASHPLAPLEVAETFFVDSSSFGGESGAPVVAWEGEDALVIGVITSMQRQTDRTKTPLEERISHMPLGLGIAVQSPLLRSLLE